jgi:TetR/AcrR family transcriptional regulator, tetracycline repressor protein
MLPCTPYSCQVTSVRTSDPKPDAADQPAAEGERTRLTREAVVDRALVLADKSGLGALTIRKLATELGVTPMALYWHFHGKDELLDGLADQVWSEIDVTVNPSAPWTEQLRGMLNSLVAVLRAHSSAAQLLIRSERRPDKLNSASQLNAIEAALGVLLSAGFSPQDASAIARMTLWTGITLAMSEPGTEALDEDERVETQRKKLVSLATLPLAKYPHLVECAGPITACDDPQEHYRFGVEMFIAGAAARHADLGAVPAAG